MNLKDLATIELIESFLDGTQNVIFEVGGSKDERYRWIEEVLKQHHYRRLGKRQRGVIRHFLQHVTGYSRATVTRLIRQYEQHSRLRRRQTTSNGFARRYTAADIRLLAEVDQLHHTPNGYAVKQLCERAWQVFADPRFERLARISVAHLYRLRRSTTYRQKRTVIDKTRANKVPIGQRRPPKSDGQPGYLRVDSVHQGDLDKRKGLYHVNAVDEVTQFEIVVTVERISERFMIPALADLIEQFPFQIRGFHADNGSEYINRHVAEMLEKLLIELTKSRPRNSNDNALVEGKNGAVVRKLFGHHHIPQHFAEPMNEFNRTYLNPHLNFHRPCLFAEETMDARGKIKMRYPYHLVSTPYEKLKSLENAEQYLKSNISFAELDAIAYAKSDNESARTLNLALKKLNQQIHEPGHRRA